MRNQSARTGAITSGPDSAVTAVPGSVLWKADGESTIASEWASSSSVPVAAAPPNPDPSRIAQSTFAAQGQRSYRFEMRAGEDSYGARAELGQGLPNRAGFENRWFRAGGRELVEREFDANASAARIAELIRGAPATPVPLAC